MNRQTYLAKNNEVQQNWLHVDATGLTLGRLSVKLAVILMGKNKPEYTPHHDVGDFVVVTNVDKVVLSGNKAEAKLYKTYSGHPGGQKTRSYQWMIDNRPELLLRRSVQRMLPKNRIARQMLGKLKTYRTDDHPHTAQQPKTVTL